jgi:hypothetical protein
MEARLSYLLTELEISEAFERQGARARRERFFARSSRFSPAIPTKVALVGHLGAHGHD